MKYVKEGGSLCVYEYISALYSEYLKEDLNCDIVRGITKQCATL